MVDKNTNQGFSHDTKTLIVFLTLIFVYPVGLVLMFMWMKWKTWIKILVAFPVVIFFLIFIVSFLATLNPGAQVKKANCTKLCNTQGLVGADLTDCVQDCLSVDGSQSY